MHLIMSQVLPLLSGTSSRHCSLSNTFKAPKVVSVFLAWPPAQTAAFEWHFQDMPGWRSIGGTQTCICRSCAALDRILQFLWHSLAALSDMLNAAQLHQCRTVYLINQQVCLVTCSMQHHQQGSRLARTECGRYIQVGTPALYCTTAQAGAMPANDAVLTHESKS